ncbi:MAG TPA: hypothetical protein PLW65_20590 [Pseudomonadota bacterium]|nr:hypothetical protein [Pseudomonadota bacterium]
MSTNPDCPNPTFYRCSAVLLTLCALTGCDAFLVSICEFEELPACSMMAAVSSTNPDMSKSPDLAVPVIKEATFSLRTSFAIDGYHKFNGIIDKKMLTIARKSNGSLSWEAWRFDLNNPVEMSRSILTNIVDIPNIPSDFDFFKDEIYTAGQKYYHFQHVMNRQLFEFNGSNRRPIMAIKLTDSSQPRAFAHPLFNAFVVAAEPTPPQVNSTVAVSDGFPTVLVASATPTAFVVGDLDSNDPTNNGEEIILFNGKTPQSVSHWVPNESTNPDDELLASLKLTIARTKAGDESPIEAAFITGLNGDVFPDLVYSRNGQVYVTSYLGKDKKIESRFKDWPEKIASISGEKIKSLVAVELTNDAYPELVVETDKAVHFYVNTPK